MSVIGAGRYVSPCLCVFLQTPKRESSAPARRCERGHPLHLPSASAQTLHWLHPQPHCGQQGNILAVIHTQTHTQPHI